MQQGRVRTAGLVQQLDREQSRELQFFDKIIYFLHYDLATDSMGTLVRVTLVLSSMTSIINHHI